MKKKFRRNAKKVDTEIRAATALRMSRNNVELMPHQILIFKNCMTFASSTEELDCKVSEIQNVFKTRITRIPATGKFIDFRGAHFYKSSNILDCTAADAAAWYFNFLKSDVEETAATDGTRAFFQVRHPSNRQIVNEKIFAKVTRPPLPFFRPVEFIFKVVWKVEDDGSVVIGVWPDTDTKVNYGDTFGKLARGSIFGLFRARNIQTNASKIASTEIRQCTITVCEAFKHPFDSFFDRSRTYHQHIRMLNNMTSDLVEDKLADEADLNDMVAIVVKNDENYTLEEQQMLERGKVMFKECSKCISQLTQRINTYDPGVHLRVGKTEDGTGIGYVSVVVDANLATCLAYLFLLNTRERSKSTKFSRIIKVKKLSNHAILTTDVVKDDVKNLGLMKGKIFFSKIIWQKDSRR